MPHIGGLRHSAWQPNDAIKRPLICCCSNLQSIPIIQSSLTLNFFLLQRERGDLGVVEQLLRFPTIDINRQDSRGMTPAMHALMSGEFYNLQLLLMDDRTDANITNICGQTLLHLAARRANAVAIQILVRHARIDVNCRNAEGETPLLLAAKQTCCDKSGQAVLSLLDSANVDINTRDISRRTPLWYAAEGHDDDLVCVILQRLDVDFCGDQDSVTPLTLAVRRGRESIVKHVLCHPNFSIPVTGAAVSPMWDACRLGNLNLVRELLRWNVIDVNQMGPTGTSPLQVAIIGQHVSIVRLLLGQGDRVSVNDRGPQEWSALTFAAAAGHDEIVSLLLGNPHIDVNHTDDLGRRPLWWAVHGVHLKTIHLLRRDSSTCIAWIEISFII